MLFSLTSGRARRANVYRLNAAMSMSPIRSAEPPSTVSARPIRPANSSRVIGDIYPRNRLHDISDGQFRCLRRVAPAATFQTAFRFVWWQSQRADALGHERSGMEPVSGATFVALAVAMLTFELLFWRGRRWL